MVAVADGRPHRRHRRLGILAPGLGLGGDPVGPGLEVAAAHGGVELRVELHRPDVVCEGEGLDLGVLVPGEAHRPGGQAHHHVLVALLDLEEVGEAREEGVGAALGGQRHGHRAHLPALGAPHHLAPEGVGDQLVAEAHPEDGHPEARGPEDEARGLGDPVVGIVDRGRGPGDHHPGEAPGQRQGIALVDLHQLEVHAEALAEEDLEVAPGALHRGHRVAGLEEDEGAVHEGIVLPSPSRTSSRTSVASVASCSGTITVMGT